MGEHNLFYLLTYLHVLIM